MSKYLACLLVAVALLGGLGASPSPAQAPQECKFAGGEPTQKNVRNCQDNCAINFESRDPGRKKCDAQCVKWVEDCKKKLEGARLKAIKCHDPVVACLKKCKDSRGKDCEKTCASGETRKTYDACMKNAKSS